MGEKKKNYRWYHLLAGFGLLAAAVAGRSVAGPGAQVAENEGTPGSVALGMEPGQLAERLRASVNEALGIGGGA